MKSSDNVCLNCEYQLAEELYCPSCGQKARTKNLSLFFFLSTFYIAFLDFDKKMLRSLRDIWIPNKISNSFLSGGRTTYVNHLRFFIICLAVFFGLVALNLRSVDLEFPDLEKQSILNHMLSEVEALEKRQIASCDSIFLDSLKHRLFSDLSFDGDSTIKVDNNIVNLEFSKNSTAFDLGDLYNLSPDSILSKYKVTSPRGQFFATQGIKVVKNGGSAIKFWVSNMFWGIILITILMAIFLKIIYYRHHSFYVEHLMHMINYHCVLMILLSVKLLLNLIGNQFPSLRLFSLPEFFIASLMIFISGVYLNISLKGYYNQSWLNTILKAVILLMAYLFCIMVVIVIILGISVVFF